MLTVNDPELNPTLQDKDKEDNAVSTSVVLMVNDPPVFLVEAHTDEEHESLARKRRASRKRVMDSAHNLHRSSRLMAKEEPNFEPPAARRPVSKRPSLTTRVRLAASVLLLPVPNSSLILLLLMMMLEIWLRSPQPVVPQRRSRQALVVCSLFPMGRIFNLCFWNVRGLGDHKKCSDVLAELLSSSPTLFFFRKLSSPI
jgi:hypothetical protein